MKLPEWIEEMKNPYPLIPEYHAHNDRLNLIAVIRRLVKVRHMDGCNAVCNEYLPNPTEKELECTCGAIEKALERKP